MRWPRERIITSDDPSGVEILDPREAMDRAVLLAYFGPEHGPNPRVGCVLTTAEGAVIGEGFHRGAGTAHAEVDAIANARQAGHDVTSATAYVTLEPCRHTGRTGPCVDALIEVGITRVVYAVSDPGGESGRGAAVLRERGVEVSLEPTTGAEEVTRRWRTAVERGRPYVIAKFAVTLDGRTAAADGSSFWITGEEARAHAHAIRANVDAILVGTGTAIADEPLLTARPGGHTSDHQPLRVVMGLRDAELPEDGGEAVYIKSREPLAVLEDLAERDVRTVLVEGGATVTTAFFEGGFVDEVHAYVAPAVLGAGTSAVDSFGIETMADVLRLERVETLSLGVDTLVAGLVPEKG